MMESFPETLVIIGAPRSGTNILRDVLTSLPDFGTWPCDEINFVWKHGNISYAYDDLGPEAVKKKTSEFVRKQFRDVARQTASNYVVEKTCANSMRVEYVDRIVPEAKYALLLRNGEDAVRSMMHRWQHPVPDKSYYLSKSKFIAPADLLWVSWQTMKKRAHGLLHPGARSWNTWGPMTPELQRYVDESRPLSEICSLQWSQCVSKSLAAFEKMDPSRWIAVSFEDFLRNPESEIARILGLLSVSIDPAEIGRSCAMVSAKGVGRSGLTIDKQQAQGIESLVEPTMNRVRATLGAL